MKKIGIALLVIALVGWMLKDTFTQSGIEDLKGGFKEIASYRNENNTGPVQRIYVVTVKDSTGAQLQDYGNLMPHNKYGNTKVYYFLEGNNVPTKLSPGAVNFDVSFNQNCFALYEKSAMGNVGLVRWPFK
ncbi:hypothetical protein [Pedobacter sp.]|uniref:hypothetical protein n=1 Tax=Pedobacter sp. TaxID=1411316 RepID=UPI0031D38221